MRCLYHPEKAVKIFQRAFYFENGNRKICAALCLFTSLWLWEGGPGRKTPSRKATDWNTLNFLYSPFTL